MKLVATSDFRNPDPDNIDVPDKLHDLHVHKGARFEIGGDLPVEKLTAGQRRIVVELNAASRIVEASQTDLVKRIDAEVTADRKKAAAEAAAAKK